MTIEQKKLWLLVAEKTGSNLEARMIYDELIKNVGMSVLLSIIESEEGLEVHISEKAYNNFNLIGLIEQIKLNLLSDPPQVVAEKPIDGTSQKYDA